MITFTFDEYTNASADAYVGSTTIIREVTSSLGSVYPPLNRNIGMHVAKSHNMFVMDTTHTPSIRSKLDADRPDFLLLLLTVNIIPTWQTV